MFSFFGKSATRGVTQNRHASQRKQLTPGPKHTADVRKTDAFTADMGIRQSLVRKLLERPEGLAKLEGLEGLEPLARR